MIRVQPSAYLMAAALVLLLPLDWLLAAIMAAVFHEAGHLIAIHAAGGRVSSVSIDFLGARIHTGPLENRAEFFCAAAGPTASLLLLSLCRWFPQLALCGLVQGMFNLIPVHPMDGGRMLYCMLRRLCPRQADRVLHRIEWVILFGILSLSLTLAVRRRDTVFPVLMCIPVLSRLLLSKIPCKSGRFAVQ
ncbi:MAG: hypothetical protein Q4F81_07425 [Eubacteriales bacterium]|nr:hypothetical protein [Eubacteriales bacterium]